MASRLCELCTSDVPALAVVFCDADSCFLCAACDVQVHEANRLAQRHIRRPVSATDVQPASEESDILVPDVDGTNLTDSLSRDGSGLCDADVAYADFEDFEGVAFGKMPSLNASDSDTAFLSIVPAGGLKAFDSDLSWEAVVPEEFEHVVPDIEAVNPPVSVGKPNIVSAPKSESAVCKSSIAATASVPACPVVPVTTGRPHVCKSPYLKAAFSKMESPAFSHVTVSAPSASLLSSSVLPTGNIIDAVTSSSAAESSKTQVLSSESASKLEFGIDLVLSSTSGKQDGVEDEKKTAEQRKQLRAEALVRFRAKRANRSFQKKIRYGCRKVLAESRPRVKGRFVKKCDMALYALHGSDYAKFKVPVPVDSDANDMMEQVIPGM